MSNQSGDGSSFGRRGYDKLSIVWGVGCSAFGIIFTILFSKFVDSYSDQARTQNEILNRITGIEAQMIMADFPTLRTDLEKVESEVKALKIRHGEEVRDLNNKIGVIQMQIEDLKYGKG